VRPDLKGLRVLIVDDNQTNRLILQHQITSWNMIGALASGPNEALAALRAAALAGKPFDLALLDFQMPEMDGLSLAVTIKANPILAKRS
jgi:CheY-like chemotaxis protein